MKKFLFSGKACKISNELNYGGYSCPRCGDWMCDDDDVCQTCGYPWND